MVRGLGLWVRVWVRVRGKKKEKKGKEMKGQDRKGQDRTGQDRTGHVWTGQDRTGPDSTVQDRRGQYRSEHLFQNTSIYFKEFKNVQLISKLVN